MSAPAQDTVVTVSAHVKRVAVVGGGTMGNGIAQVFATHGFDVRLVDAKAEFVERALGTIGKSLDRVAKKQGWEDGRAAAILARIAGGTDLAAARDCQLVVEAVTESWEVKKAIFTALDAACPPETILASNTSSIPIGEIAALTKRADRVIGMHFMNPVPVMQLVEIIRGIATSDATYAVTEELSRRLGKTP
ncbi:MAG: 3-hydroxyacyl-CoA dehydrogenase NAD-binding domain-containing protein, partial [bacterium]